MSRDPEPPASNSVEVTVTLLAEQPCPRCGKLSPIYFETRRKHDEDGEHIYSTEPILECGRTFRFIPARTEQEAGIYQTGSKRGGCGAVVRWGDIPKQ